MKRSGAELIFIPIPEIGHLVSAVKMANILLDRDDRLSISVLIMKLPHDNHTTPSDDNKNPRLKFIDLPNDDTVISELAKSPHTFFYKFIEYQQTNVRNIVAGMASSSSSSSSSDLPQLAAFVADMFCAGMIDVANEFGLPTYLFFTSNASFLGTQFHFQTQTDENNKEAFNLDTEVSVPCFKNRVPARVVPFGLLDGGDWSDTAFNRLVRRITETKGIIINTFKELESFALQSLYQEYNLPIYEVGPLLTLNSNNNDKNKDEYEDIINWLDSQPSSSVVFLCFGSLGAFEEKQVKDIAIALENSGHRFLWSLRKRPKTGEYRISIDETNPEEVLPEGFLERTKEIGKIIGWAPQVAVLSHPSVGGFVTHCGWNSILESIYFGVPMTTWPLYSEQNLNAFLLVKELEIALEIKIDFQGGIKGDITDSISAEKIEGHIRQLMMPMEDEEVGLRKKVKDMKEKSRAAILEGGSSYIDVGRLIEDITRNINA